MNNNFKNVEPLIPIDVQFEEGPDNIHTIKATYADGRIINAIFENV